MQVFRSLKEVSFDKKSVLTLGTFDGIHLGHQQIISKVIEDGKAEDLRTFVLTFEPHPLSVLSKGYDIKILSTLEEKIKIFESLGIENLFVINFTKEFSQLSPKDFIEQYLVNGIGCEKIVIGYDHHFGKGRGGNVDILNESGEKNEFKTDLVDSFSVNENIISSTKIRKALLAGEVSSASEMLGRYYSFSGVVVGGDKRGRELGYPTANIQMQDKSKLLPAIGIYAVRVILSGKSHNGLLSIGSRPTFYDDGDVVTEVYIIDFNKEIYGEKITIEVVERLRGEQKFNSTEELISQMDKDKENGIKILKQIINPG